MRPGGYHPLVQLRNERAYKKPFFMGEKMIIKKILDDLFEYDKENGVFKRKIKTWKSNIGDVVGTIDCAGYLKVSINNKFYYLHRLVWFYENGEMPKNVIDHINGVRTDNRICNLRNVTIAENIQNQKKFHLKNRSTNTLGVYQSDRIRPTAKIKVGGKSIHLGTFKTVEEAHQAYVKAKRKLHKGNTL